MSNAGNTTAAPASEDAVPKAVVSRLSLYLRELHHLVRDGVQTTSSTHLGKLLGFTDAQVRKDLAMFGQFGRPGIGYPCVELVLAIKNILGTDRAWPVCLVGMGNLGQALLGYKGFARQGFNLVAAFEVDEDLVGRPIQNVPVYHLRDAVTVVPKLGIQLAILAVPASAAQGVAEELVAAGVEGFLNFAPVTLTLPERIRAAGVDLAMELEQLSFAVVRKNGKCACSETENT